MAIHYVNEKTAEKINTAVNDNIEVELDENPTTGYFWKIVSINKEDIEVESENNEPYEGAGIGGGRRKIFKLKILKKASGQIKFENIQKWSGDVYRSFNLLYS